MLVTPAGWALEGWEFGSDFVRCNLSRQLSAKPAMAVGDKVFIAAAIMSSIAGITDPDLQLLYSDWKPLTLTEDGESGASMLVTAGAALASALLMW